MARHLDELLGAQDAMDRRHERWRAELEELFAGMMSRNKPLLAVASIGVVAPEGGRGPHPWKAQADRLGGFRASMVSMEELRVKEPPPGWMLQAAPPPPPPAQRLQVGSKLEGPPPKKATAAAAQPRRKKGTRPRTKPATYKATTSRAVGGVEALGASIQEAAAAAKG